MGLSLISAICGILVFAGWSFFFALAETALFTLRKWEVRQLVEREPQAGGAVASLLRAPQDLLATIVLGNTYANAGMVTVGLWTLLHQDLPTGAVLLGVLVLILVGGEVLPKTLAVRAPEFWAARVAGPMALMVKGTRPLRGVAQGVNSALLRWLAPTALRAQSSASSEDYAELLELAYQQGALGQSEKEIILQIMSLEKRTAKDVMKPRAQICFLPDDLPVEEMIAAARRHRHRRLPLFDETPDTIVGVLNTRALLLDPRIDLADAIEFPSFVPESANLFQLLKSLQRQQRGMAIVLDEYGGNAGLVTTEDILGLLVGGIRGEGGAEGFVMEKLAPGRWRVNGTMRLEDFRREYPGLGEVPEVDTMGGLAVFLAQVVPAQGQSVVFRGLRLTASAADERRVRELLVETLRKGEVA